LCNIIPMKTKTLTLTVDFGEPNSKEADYAFDRFWDGDLVSASEKELRAKEVEDKVLGDMLFALEEWTEDSIPYDMKILREALKQRRASLQNIIDKHRFRDDENEDGKTNWSEEPWEDDGHRDE
jgi:hypothetical protein